ncbi:MAG: Acyl-ACP thioesterase [Ignavibacteriae bacterium]|nr:MAG: Acyl-ACP thioesterase [Ignavibacteriota bacterium]
MNLIRREVFKIKTYETDFNNAVKVSSIFNYMQEAASNNAQELHFGYDELVKNNLYWVLSRALLVMKEYPKFSDEIVIETWPSGIEKFFAFRDFKIFNSQNKLIGYAITMWLLMDANRKKPVKPDEYFKDIKFPELAHVTKEVPKKIVEPELKEYITKKKVLYSDIDVNQHVNNVKYIEYAFDGFELERIRYSKARRVQINFLNETKYNEELSIYRSKLSENIFYLDGVKSDGEFAFQMIVELG